MVSAAALGALGCCQQVRGDDPSPLFSPGEVTPLESCVQFWTPQ